MIERWIVLEGEGEGEGEAEGEGEGGRNKNYLNYPSHHRQPVSSDLQRQYPVCTQKSCHLGDFARCDTFHHLAAPLLPAVEK